MSGLLYYEGTSDFLAATPALIITLKASGSITAGRAVVGNTSDPANVYMPSGVPSGSVIPAGVALATVSNGDPVPVLVWGYAKSLPTLPSTGTLGFGNALVITGSGYWTASGSSNVVTVAGKVISGSAGYTFALIDCMRTVYA